MKKRKKWISNKGKSRHRPGPKSHSITFKDTDGRMIEAYIIGNVPRSSQLFRRKAIHVECARLGLQYPKMTPDDSLSPNPELACRISDMTLLAWLRYVEVLAGWREVKAGHYYINRWALDEEE